MLLKHKEMITLPNALIDLKFLCENRLRAYCDESESIVLLNIKKDIDSLMYNFEDINIDGLKLLEFVSEEVDDYGESKNCNCNCESPCQNHGKG